MVRRIYFQISILLVITLFFCHAHKNTNSKSSKNKSEKTTKLKTFNHKHFLQQSKKVEKEKLLSKSSDPSGVGDKATKKQVLDTPQKENEESSLAENEQDGGLTGFGSDVNGVPTGMGAGGEPLGVYENQRVPNNEMDVRQHQQLFEDQEALSSIPANAMNHKGEIQDTPMGDQSQVDIDPNAMKMDSYGNQRNEYKLGLDPNQLTESPSDLTQSISIAGINKNINIQGDQDVGELIQQQKQQLSSVENQNRVLLKNYHHSLMDVKAKAFERSLDNKNSTKSVAKRKLVRLPQNLKVERKFKKLQS